MTAWFLDAVALLITATDRICTNLNTTEYSISEENNASNVPEANSYTVLKSW
jgi:hypothetical protein